MALKRDDVVVKYGADDTRFQKVSKRVLRTGSQISKGFTSFGASIGRAFGIGAGVAGGGLIAGVAKLTQELDALGKTAKGLNTTVEGLSALQYAVERTSTLTGEQFATTLQKLVKHIGQASRGGKESQKIFQELGLSWEYLASLDSDQAFIEVADALSRMSDDYKRASITQKLFEDRWRDITATIMEGREGLEALTAEAHELGVPTDEAALAAARLNDQISILSKQMDGLAYTYGPPVIDFLTYWTQTLTGVSGITNALDATIDRVTRLQMELDALQGHGTWFDTFWTSFLTDAEKAPVIERMTKEIADLRKEADKLYMDQRKRESETGTAGSPAPGASTGSAGGKAKGSASKEESRLDVLRRAILSYDAGEIDAIKLGEQTGQYAEGTLRNGAYGTMGNTSRGTSPQEVADAIADSTQWAMDNRVYKIKVVPELVGMEGVEVAAQDTADKEGNNGGGSW